MSVSKWTEGVRAMASAGIALGAAWRRRSMGVVVAKDFGVSRWLEREAWVSLILRMMSWCSRPVRVVLWLLHCFRTVSRVGGGDVGELETSAAGCEVSGVVGWIGAEPSPCWLGCGGLSEVDEVAKPVGEAQAEDCGEEVGPGDWEVKGCFQGWEEGLAWGGADRGCFDAGWFGGLFETGESGFVEG